MEKLVSDEELAALAEFAELGMQTQVSIYRRTTEVNYSTGWDDSSGTSEQFAADPVLVDGELPKGWLREQPDYTLSDTFDAIKHDEDARLFLPLAVSVYRGDKVVVNGVEYAAISDNRHNTYRVLTRVSLRRSE